MALDKKIEAEVSTSAPSAPAAEPRDADVGGALRAAYQSTLEEAIPPEMLELLSKLK